MTATNRDSPRSVLRQFFSPFKPIWQGWAWGLVATVFMGLASASQFVNSTSISLMEVGRMATGEWLIWALMAPLLFRLAARLPIERERWKLAIPVHALFCIGTVAFSVMWAQWWMPPHPKPPELPPLDFSLSHETSFNKDRTFHGPMGHGPPPDHLFWQIGPRLGIYLSLISVAHALHFYKRSMTREKRSLELSASLAKARLDTLKMQLQPHFLFNALNSIAGLVHQDPNAADEMLTCLSGLLRSVLETSEEDELPLLKEMDFVERYLAIEKVRFGPRLRIITDIASDTASALVPTFILQPLVENAILHGLQSQRGQGELAIRSRREGKFLHLAVSDNGAGLSSPATMREGIGLANTRARLKEHYGDSASLKLLNGSGLTVEISVPWRNAS